MADTAHATAVLLIVTIHAHTAAIEVQVVRVVSIGRTLHGRPIATVRTGFVQRTGRIAVSDSGKLQRSEIKRADVYKSFSRRIICTALPVYFKDRRAVFVYR